MTLIGSRSIPARRLLQILLGGLQFLLQQPGQIILSRRQPLFRRRLISAKHLWSRSLLGLHHPCPIVSTPVIAGLRGLRKMCRDNLTFCLRFLGQHTQMILRSSMALGCCFYKKFARLGRIAWHASAFLMADAQIK